MLPSVVDKFKAYHSLPVAPACPVLLGFCRASPLSWHLAGVSQLSEVSPPAFATCGSILVALLGGLAVHLGDKPSEFEGEIGNHLPAIFIPFASRLLGGAGHTGIP